MAHLPQALERVLRGDLSGLADIESVDHAAVRGAAEALGEPLVVTRTAAVSVLRGLLDGGYSPGLCQVWASFVRRGYAAPSAGGPVRPLDIEFEEAWEDGISTTVSRLDEIGDVVDGEVTTDEALDLLLLLGEP
jgi:hypothetical protein